jgi:hypothetical protein
MSTSFESRKNSQATMITAAFAAFMILLMLFWKWKLPVFEVPIENPSIEVELNLPDEPQTLASGGGGGGNPVKASGPAGISRYVPPQPGSKEDSKDVVDDNDKTKPDIVKPQNPKPTATKITESKSIVKTEPKPIVETPAPPKPKAVLGKTIMGTGKGGGSIDDFKNPGGSGNGYGVGKGNGTGGGTGNGNGGGNGNGSGPGNGPKVTNGDRKIVRFYSFQGDLDKAVVYANISVSPEGTGKFIGIARGSSTSNNSYKEAIIQYLQNIKFDKSDHESMVTVQFNFRVN